MVPRRAPDAHHRVVHGGDPISSVIGGPVSGLLLRMDGIAGLAGWQWLFLVEGLPVVVVGLACCGCWPTPRKNTAWLSDEEKAIVRRRLESERRPKEWNGLGSRSATRACWFWLASSSGFSWVMQGSALPAADSRYRTPD